MKVILPLIVVPIVLLGGPARAQDTRESTVRTRERVTVRGVPGVPVEVISTDSTAGTITLRADGNARIYVVGPDAAGALQGIGPGDKVMLRWRYNKAGQPEAVISAVPASIVVEKTTTAMPASIVVEKTTTAETVSTAPGPIRVLRPASSVETDLPDPAGVAAARIVKGLVEVLEIDTAGRTLTVLDDHGDQRIVPIDDRAVNGLAELRPGSRAELAWGPNGRVVYITIH
jgi:hypothetical protein